MSKKRLSAPNGLSLAAAKPLSPNELLQSYTPSSIQTPPSGSPSAASASGATTPRTPRTPSSSSTSNHIKVICRFRPKNSKERAEEKRQNLCDESQKIEVYGDGRSLCIPRGKKKPALNYTLDSVIWSDKNQEETFISLAKPTVESVIEGYNCTIFAFGQTGSGKTYTMFGPEALGKVQELGIIPRCVDYMFKLLSNNGNILKYQISLSIVEVYKEMLRDLLTTEKKNRKRLEILSAGKEIRVKNVTEKACGSVSEILKCIVLAQSNRAKHTTDFIGHDSSRSHCVVMISLTQRMLDDSIKFSKLNFGDLAGSELAAKTGTKGASLKEAGKIHQGLLALENVINALVEKKKHVPYNDSKLTRLLSSSIGGNSKTTLLVTCSPSIWNRDETVSTLRFAKRAKKIKNVARINKKKTREQLEARINYLEKENRELKKKISKRKYGGPTMKNMVNKNNEEELVQKDKEINECLDEIIKLKDLLSKKEDRMLQMTRDLEMKQDILSSFESENGHLTTQIRSISDKLAENEMEVDMLQNKLEAKIEIEAKFASHSQKLQNIVNDSVKDNSSTTIAALTEITQQQNEFFLFLKKMSEGIEKIHEKQHENEKDINFRFDSMTETIQNIELSGILGGNNNNYDASMEAIGGHHPQSSGSLLMFDQNLNDLSLNGSHSRGVSGASFMSSMTSMMDRSDGDRETLSELISSMRSYLDADVAIKKKVNNENKVKENKAATIGSYSINDRVDVLDVSYIWYSATILDIDAFEKHAVYVHYDDFDDAWNEWIPLTKKYRLARSASRTDIAIINPSLRTEHGGVHCLIATKYGRTPNAQDLQNVFSSQNYDNECLSHKAILFQAHLYKQSSWSKKTWKRRWFVIRNNKNIYYYDHKNVKAKQYRGVIALKDVAVIQMAKIAGYTKYSFDIITIRNKKHRFSANNEEDLTDWLSVLECLVYSDCHQINNNNNNKIKSAPIKPQRPQLKKANSTMTNNDDAQQIKRPSISPRIRDTISGFFSAAKPTTPRKTYTASYEFVDD